MDESTNGKSSLRFVTDSKTRQVQTNQNKRVEKRKKLRQEKKNQFSIQLWQVLVYGSISGSLGFLFINNGWSPINAQRIHIKGNSSLRSMSIIRASGLLLPEALLVINPKELKNTLLKELPIKTVSIRRHLIPPHIEVELQERAPIAFAKRLGPQGQEQGMVDITGKWMPLRVANQAKQPTSKLYVEGWKSSHRKWISMILKNRHKLGDPLTKVILNPNGELSLQTKRFGTINLGTNTNQLNKQIQALDHLINNLPSNFSPKNIISINMIDPSKPELKLQTP